MNEYTYITSGEELHQVLKLWKKDEGPGGDRRLVCGIDTETTGLDPWIHRLRLLQIARQGFESLVIDCFALLPEYKEPMQDLLDLFKVKVFQNAKFDIKFLYTHGLQVRGQVFDTMLAGLLLRTSGGPRRVGLGQLAEHFTGIVLPKELQVSDFSGQLSEEQLRYAANDASILLKLRAKMIQELKMNRLIEVARVEFNCAYAIAYMELWGIHLDVAKWQALTLAKEQERDKILDKLYLYIGLPRVQMGLFSDKKESHFNPNSNKQVLGILEKEGIHVENTSKHALTEYLDHPFVDNLIKYRHVEKELSAFLHVLEDHLNPVTKRLHPRYGQNGAYSGRMSCGNPNIQQIPRSQAFRQCFNAPKGRMMVIADYSQIELRVMAEFTKDKRMIEAYKNGEDLHRLTASLILDKKIETITKEERQAAKAVNFGLVFGMGAAGLMAYAAYTYATRMTMEEAELFKKRYFQAYKGVNAWQEKIKITQPVTTRTLAGRKNNYGPDTGLSARYNTPIQGTAADILKNALGNLYHEIMGTNILIVAVVHDEIVLECSENQVDDCADMLKRVMETAGNRYLKEVPVIAEVAISNSWAGK